MKSFLKRIGQVLGDTKVRVLLLVAVILIVIIGVMSYLVIRRVAPPGEQVGARVVAPSRIQAVPGGVTPSEAYLQSLQQYNLQQAQEALKTKGAAVPTIGRGVYIGQPLKQEQPDKAAPKEGCSVEALKRARQAGVTASELKCRGCSAKALKEAGYTASELKAAGYSAKALKDAGFSAKQLRDAGFSAKQLKDAGFTPKQLKDAGYSARALKEAGFSAKQLKDAGFNGKQLKDAGFGAKALKDAGFSAKQLKDAGYNARQLKDAGYSDSDLQNAGFTGQQIADAKKDVDCSLERLKQARQQGVTAAQLVKQGCDDPSKLRQAGYTAGELKDAGFSAAQLKDAGFSAGDLRDAGFSAKQLKDAGFSGQALKDAGFNANQLKDAGFSAAQLSDAGFSADDLSDAGFSPENLSQAGFSGRDLKEAGVSCLTLRNQGYTRGQLIRAGYTAEECGFAEAVPEKVTQKDLTPSQMKQRGMSAKQLKEAGYDCRALLKGNYSQQEVLNAGYTRQECGLAPAEEAAPGAPAAAAMPGPPGEEGLRGELQQIQERQEKMMTQQQRQSMLRRIESAMESRANNLVARWRNVPQHQMVEGEPPKQQAGQGVGQGVGQGPGGGQRGAGQEEITGPTRTIKAGSVMFAILNTPINSDQKNARILATVVQGPLRGSKLMGTFTRQDDRVILKFDRLSVPYAEKSQTIDAYAIDADTARTALASRVNHHYMLRYGSLFAASFMEGLGKTIRQSGSQTTVSQAGITQTFPDLGAGEKALGALGTVGQRYAQNMKKNFTVPPTVYVDAGTGIGVLIMNDVKVPVQPQ